MGIFKGGLLSALLIPVIFGLPRECCLAVGKSSLFVITHGHYNHILP